MSGLSSSPLTQQPQKATRKRKSYSCVQCRFRKKQCDRKLPCSQCRSRDEAELCRWGDERDEEETLVPPQRRRTEDSIASLSTQGVFSAVQPAPSSQADESKNLFDALSRADIHSDQHLFDSQPTDTPESHSTPGKSIFTSTQPKSSRTSDVSRSIYSPKSVVITCNQARHLVYTYIEQGGRIIAWIDSAAIWEALDQTKTKDFSELRHSKPDLFALITVICASGLILLPTTYIICMGLIGKSSDLGPLLNRLEEEVITNLDHMFDHPTLYGVQAMAVYQLNLSPRVSERDHIIRMDEFTRACRRMGLDKLGSAQEDERLWMADDMRQGECHSIVPTTPFVGYFAGETFIKRDRAVRNRARAIWCFAVTKDWVSSRVSGSCSIHPDSFTTTVPTPYSFNEEGTSQKDALIWTYLVNCSSITYKYFNLCSAAQSFGKRVDYDKILELDKEIILELDRRPPWLRAEDSLGKTGSEWCSIEAILISTSFWNRMFALHRPFLALSRSEPEKYGLSSSRSFNYAILCIQIMKEGTQNGVLLLKQLTFHFRLLQAALVVITHLFLGHETISMKETISIHQDLNFAISTFKQLSNVDPNGYFASQGERLEALLAKAARLVRQTARCQGNTCAPTMIIETPQEDESLSNLDDQLLKLSQSWPLGIEEDSNNQIWSDLFSMLDSEKMPP